MRKFLVGRVDLLFPKYSLFVAAVLSLIIGCKNSAPQNAISVAAEQDSGTFVVTRPDGDTVGQVALNLEKEYDYFGSKDSTLIMHRNSLKKIPGFFGFGITGKGKPLRKCWLTFEERGKSDLNERDSLTVPFLSDEYQFATKVNVGTLRQGIDFTGATPLKYKIYFATDARNKQDTVLYQETTQCVLAGNRFLALIVYQNFEEREEMARYLSYFAEKMKQSLVK